MAGDDEKLAEIRAWGDGHADRVRDRMFRMPRHVYNCGDSERQLVYLLSLVGRLAAAVDEWGIDGDVVLPPENQEVLDDVAAAAMNWSYRMEYERRDLQPRNYR